MPVLQSQNALQGALPQDSTLVSLKVLDVSRNQLTGAVPLLQHSSNLQVAPAPGAPGLMTSGTD